MVPMSKDMESIGDSSSSKSVWLSSGIKLTESSSESEIQEFSIRVGMYYIFSYLFRYVTYIECSDYEATS